MATLRVLALREKLAMVREEELILWEKLKRAMAEEEAAYQASQEGYNDE